MHNTIHNEHGHNLLKTQKVLKATLSEILPTPSDDESKVIKVATSHDHLLILHKNQTLWSENNNNGQCGIDISDGAFIQYQQTTHSNITDIFAESNISCVIDSARRLKKIKRRKHRTNCFRCFKIHRRRMLYHFIK